MLKDRNCPPTIWQPAKTAFKNEGEIKRFFNKQKLRGLIATRSSLQEMLEVFQAKENNTDGNSDLNKGRALQMANMWVNVKDCPFSDF